MRYRYKLKNTDENMKLKSRIINGVKLSIDAWVKSDVPLKFQGFEDQIDQERVKEDFEVMTTKHVAKRVEQTPAIIVEPPVEEVRTKRKYERKAKPEINVIESGIVLHDRNYLINHLFSVGFLMEEIQELSHGQLYELAVIESEISALEGETYAR